MNIIRDVRNLFRLKKVINNTTIKEVRNIFRLKKEIDDTTVKDERNLSRLKKEHQVIKDRITRDIRKPFEHE